ncbi:GTP cyclohydrolase I FolE [Tamlana sp. 2_MG-2023]|uniref:GTP cyclohydrolase I FolE n=1 Tax=unclassified Tamlana TaxID=2614803 RepID=UPI0026E3725B|nr:MULTISPECIES: GTP cyclohydrolase I FolE [unclassified Tamlana]MDO6759512.1 GTP cyclohydrolase I FolE [Tamlana sp. 2_MG-2023]MDO6790349.1 GTP cyclohydrolase I FolE [Tamlana sp. 1_MG-2023]
MKDKEQIQIEGDNHFSTNIETPLRADAFDKSDNEKIKNIQYHFKMIMEEMGLDLTDDSLSGTPYRFAKMYVKELFYGLNPANKPKLSTFDNKYGYKKMLIEQNITIDSACEHHFLPIVGHAHIGYIPTKKVIGLSKINRLVDYYSHRPQVQERLAIQILNDLQNTLETKDVIVMINAKHLCVSSRGIKDKNSFTTTLEYGGCFSKPSTRKEFLKIIGQLTF